MMAQTSTSPNDLTRLTLLEAATRVKNREVSPVALTQACLSRIDKYNPVLNAFITLTGEQALEQARQAEAEINQGQWRGYLHGIPIALKDNTDMVGVRTTAASAVYASRFPKEDAEVVRRLKAAGAVILGKLNMSEFNGVSDGTNSYWGPIHNPWDLTRVPGGSSGGSAAAIAADLCFGALGSDTGGSIRAPASYCGITGLKPTYGLVSNRGVIPGIDSLDHIGPITKTVTDAAVLLQAIAGHDEQWSKSANVEIPNYLEDLGKKHDFPRVGIPRADFFDGLEEEVRQTVEAALETVGKLSRSINDIAFTNPGFTLFGALGAESVAYHKPLRKTSAALYHSSTIKITPEPPCVTEYIDALKELEQMRREVKDVFTQVDFLVLPTLKNTAMTISEWQEILSSDNPSNFPQVYNTPGFNILGIPAISIPCGFTQTGLPVGLQIAGAPFSEAKLLAFAHAYEQATSWHLRKPELPDCQ